MIELPTVTLVAPSSVKIEENIKALIYSCKHIKFGAVKLITHEEPEYLPSFITFSKCKKMDYNGFSDFAYKDFWKHIDTEHCLYVHHDGYVLNPSLWSDDFLKYDYIGAPWPNHPNYYNRFGKWEPVGNGGFSLRSRRLLKLPTDLNLPVAYPCDMGYGNYHKDVFESCGMKYPDIHTAAKFSTEAYIHGVSINSFGFHDYKFFPQFSKLTEDIDIRSY